VLSPVQSRATVRHLSAGVKELTSSGSDGLSDFLCFAVSLKTSYPDFWGMRAFLYNSDAVPLVVAPTISPEKRGADIFIWACLRAMRAELGAGLPHVRRISLALNRYPR